MRSEKVCHCTSLISMAAGAQNIRNTGIFGVLTLNTLTRLSPLRPMISYCDYYYLCILGTVSGGLSG
jgi:hypothetical protein